MYKYLRCWAVFGKSGNRFLNITVCYQSKFSDYNIDVGIINFLELTNASITMCIGSTTIFFLRFQKPIKDARVDMSTLALAFHFESHYFYYTIIV